MAYSSNNESSDEFSSHNSSSSENNSLSDTGSDEAIHPYRFEPLRAAVGGSDESNSEQDDAVGNAQDVGEWCTCHNCEEMATAVECRCCIRVGRVKDKMEEHTSETGEELACITHHPGFQTVCLDR
ncbi:uncharacterized protein LOC128548153 [Mercenaria mercenaria]|uniref:uncharacterized protein LOC128548153 n=1 Tax=Mercenaria mercenaria TaxID=6596 RepID=UPI00234FA9FF|nr:uncharacterized protein LOC128548153 [Mercenaria mercenaria]